ncbi:MAG: glycosyltransferase [Xanthomonadales bacterium]|nr:glycosyltransferase [Xanthomonadales bacterium]
MADQMMPQVSVIMPVRDAGAYLAPAVDSILGQSLAGLELLIIDDHSRDQAITEVCRNDSRLRVITNPGRGLVEALNHGFAAAHGRFLARMDGDDLAEPERLAQQLAFLEAHPKVDIVGTQVRIFGDCVAAGNQRYQDWLNALCSPADIARELFIESPLPHPSVMLRREAWERLGGYSDDGGPEDYDLWLRAAELGLQMAKPDGILLHWRDHDGRLTRSDARYSAANFWATKARHLLRWRTAGRPLLIWGSGTSGVVLHDALVAAGCAAERLLGFVDLHPRRIGGKKRGLPVMPLEGALSAPTDTLVLVAVGTAGVREEIRQWFAQHRRKEGEDYLFTA